MVGVVVQCRLGNQLFQYAFIKALADKLGTSYFLNDKFEKFIVPNFFDLPGYSHANNRLNAAMFKVKKSPLKKLQSVLIGEYTDGILETLNDNTVYNGYFQSSKFFSNLTDEIKSLIKVKPIHVKSFRHLYGDAFKTKPTIAVHIRRGDYLNLGNWWLNNLGDTDLSLPESYYRNCLEKINDLDKYQIYFISDDISYVKKVFSDLKNVHFGENTFINDFQVILNADICVISNSSFAWWAAYLNAKATKKVFCPENWLGFKINKEYPNQIICEGWHKVPVN